MLRTSRTFFFKALQSGISDIFHEGGVSGGWATCNISGQIIATENTSFHPKWWFSKGNPLISGKARLVKYSLARYIFLVSPEFPPLEFATKPLTDKVTWDGGYPTKSPTDIEKETFESTNKYLRFIVWLPPNRFSAEDVFSFWFLFYDLCDRHGTPSSKEPGDFCVDFAGRVDGNQRRTALIFCQLNHLRLPSLQNSYADVHVF